MIPIIMRMPGETATTWAWAISLPCCEEMIRPSAAPRTHSLLSAPQDIKLASVSETAMDVTPLHCAPSLLAVAHENN